MKINAANAAIPAVMHQNTMLMKILKIFLKRMNILYDMILQFAIYNSAPGMGRNYKVQSSEFKVQ